MDEAREDPQFEDVIKVLKGLPKIEAHPAFEMDLKRRINRAAHKPENPLRRLLSPSRLVPSAAVAAAAIMILFFFKIPAPQPDDPLSVDPEVRQDLLSGASAEKYMFDRMERSDGLQIASSSGNIVKSGLNFRQINLSPEDKQKLQQLKEKFKEWIRSSDSE